MGNKLKKLPNYFLNKSPWLWRSCTQSRTLSFRTSNDIIFRTINFNSAYEENEDFQQTPRADVSDYDDNDDDEIEALVKGLSLIPGKKKRLFLDLDDTNSISTTAETAAAEVAGRWQVPFKESVAMAMESKEPYLDFKKSMEEMVEAHGLLKDWKGMEMLLSWYLMVNGKPNHEFIIGAFVDLLVGDHLPNHFDSNYSNFFSSCCNCCCRCLCCLCHRSTPSSSPSSSTVLCLSSSFVSSSCSSFRGHNCMISSNAVEIMEDIVESECCSSSSSTCVSPPCQSSLFEDEEDGSIEDHY